MAKAKKVPNGEEKVVCINWMHDAIKAAREAGNKGAIQKEFALEHGVDESKYDVYKGSISVLYEKVCDYIRYGKSQEFLLDPEKNTKTLKAKLDTVYAVWRQTLDWGEPAKNERALIVHPRDIEDLISVCQRLGNDAVYLDGTTVARKVWATVPEGAFRGKVETILGIRMAQVEVLSDAERDKLKKLRSIAGKIRKAKFVIEAESKNIADWTARLAKVRTEEMKAMLNEMIKDSEAKIAEANAKIEGQKAEFETISAEAPAAAEALAA